MTRASHSSNWQNTASVLASPRLHRFLLFLLVCLLFFYVLRRQEKRFSEIRLPSGLIPTSR